MDYVLDELNLLEVKKEISRDKSSGTFIIEPLSPGYGVTIGNTLRRILLSSLEGFAVEKVKINGASHEYSTIKGVKEDIVDIILNLKSLRFKMTSDTEVTLSLSIKGPKKVTASDFKKNAYVEIVDQNHYIATVEKGGKLELEIVVGKGRGYVPVEKKTGEKVPVGTILVDSIFTPVKKVRFDVENTRVGGMTNYNKLVMEITTDGSVTAEEALQKSAVIMSEHLQTVINSCQPIKKPSKSKKA